MPHQTLFTITTPGRGFVELTDRVAELVRALAPELTGLAHLFARHTSCGLLITENARGPPGSRNARPPLRPGR
jgi:thiamine phosphate synthase YjbQ (UPF0047 family)